MTTAQRAPWRPGPVASMAAVATLVLVYPVLELVLKPEWRISGSLLPFIFAYSIIGLGLNIVTGYTGLLHLGVAGFVAIGAYAYSILTCDIYPFRFGFWGGTALATLIACGVGAVLALPTMRLRGDYLALVTLGFSEIVEDLLKNLDPITKGTTGINPVPHPHLPGVLFTDAPSWSYYYLYLAIAALAALVSSNLRTSRVGRRWVAVREDELAARASGVDTVRAKLAAFGWGSAFAGLGGALLAAKIGTSTDPGSYDFQLSIIVLCAVIVGGMGSIGGVLLGSLLMFGFNSVVLDSLTKWIGTQGGNVLASPNNWKYLVFGLALLLAMRFRPEGLLPAREVARELHEHMPPGGSGAVPP